MPTIPFNPLPTEQSTGAPGVFQRVESDPGMFGGYTAAGAQRVGTALEQGGGTIADNAIRFQQEYNETATDQGNTQFDSQVRPIVGNFRTLRGADAMSARADTLAKIEDLRQQVRDTMQNPEQRRMFDYMSRRTAVRYQDEVEFHAAGENKVWQGDTAVGAITNEINNSATYWNDTPRFAESLGNIKVQADKLSILKGIDPNSDAGKANVTHYQSEAWSARIHSVMAQDSNLARDLFDANADQIDAAHRASLDQQITNHQWTDMARAESEQRRMDATAARQLAITQAGNLAQLTADTLQGKPVNWSNVADMVRTQQVAPHVPEFLMSLSRQRAAGPASDRADAVIALHQALDDPSVSIDDRMKAISGAARQGFITSATAGTLVDAAYRKDQRGDDQAAREARGTVLAAAGVPDGMINISHDDAVKKAAVMSEWTDRVVVKGEDPIAVRDDMVPRYMPAGMPPVTWPRPKLGPIASTQDAKTVAAATNAAFQAGRLTPEQYQAEKANIVRFATFYSGIDAARAAAATTKKQQPGDKAKPRGVIPGEGS